MLSKYLTAQHRAPNKRLRRDAAIVECDELKLNAAV